MPGTKAEVQEVHRFTTAPNAESVGFGATRRVILWDTLLDGRFDRREVRAVIAHELGHLAHHHILKRVGWLLLFLIPGDGDRRARDGQDGGLGRPEAVPLALLVFVGLAASDGAADEHRLAPRGGRGGLVLAARDPRPPGGEEPFRASCAGPAWPNPIHPTWSYVLYADHPTIVQRVAMIEAWQARNPER